MMEAVEDIPLPAILQGLRVASVSVPRGGGHVMSLTGDVVFRMPTGGTGRREDFDQPEWREWRKYDEQGRLEAIRDPEMRQRLIDEIKLQGEEGVAGTMIWFYMGEGPRPDYTEMESLYDQARAAGEHPVGTWMRLIDETNGKALFHLRGFNRDLEDLERLLATEWAMPGLGDAGAHVSQMNDSGWATFTLSHWHRDRGLYPLPEAVRRISAVPAKARTAFWVAPDEVSAPALVRYPISWHIRTKRTD